MAGIGAVQDDARDPGASSVVLFSATPSMRRRPIQVVGTERADLEEVIMALHVEHGLAQRQAADDSAPAVIDWLARCAESLRRWSAQVARSHTISSLGLAGMVGQRSCHYMDPDPLAERLVERLSLDETAPLALEPARCDVAITHLGQALA